MYYKLLNKNLLTAALVSLITLSAAKTCDAQGVVSLVEDNNAVAPQKNTAKAGFPLRYFYSHPKSKYFIISSF